MLTTVQFLESKHRQTTVIVLESYSEEFQGQCFCLAVFYFDTFLNLKSCKNISKNSHVIFNVMVLCKFQELSQIILIAKRSISGSNIIPCCLVIPSSIQKFHSLEFYYFHISEDSSSGIFFLRMSLILVCPMFLHDKAEAMLFWLEYHRSNSVFSLLAPIE